MRRLVTLLVLPALLLTGCASVEEERAANLLETKQQMWAEVGHDGPLPALDAASVAQSVIGLAHVTERMLTEGRFAGACASLEEHWDAIYLATLGEEQDYLDLVTESLHDAIVHCDDEPWEDARPFVLDADSRAHLYVTSFAWNEWQDSRN